MYQILDLITNHKRFLNFHNKNNHKKPLYYGCNSLRIIYPNLKKPRKRELNSYKRSQNIQKIINKPKKVKKLANKPLKNIKKKGLKTYLNDSKRLINDETRDMNDLTYLTVSECLTKTRSILTSSTLFNTVHDYSFDTVHYCITLFAQCAHNKSA